MVDSRLRSDPPSVFHCYVEILKPSPADGAAKFRILYPETLQDKEEICHQLPKFCYPCETDSPGVQYFTFVLTDIDGKFRYGFCRYPPHAPSCSCLLSYLPWFETFYNVLDSITELERKGGASEVQSFLEILLRQPVPEPATQFSFELNLKGSSQVFKYDVPDTTKLPSIPENRNLTEYFAAINPENMVYIFISMLFERRIIVTSKKLSLLTAVIHGSVSLLYPMQWQHIYVPILPPHLIDYCCAPMPFLLGIHASMMDRVRQMPMNEVVILDADTNEIQIILEDLDIFPDEVMSKLKAKLKRTERALADYVSSQFLRALAALIGGYRDALKYTETQEGEKIVFDDEAFLASRSGHMRTFLENILHLQSFRQFVEGRLVLLNAGLGFDDIFEEEVSKHSEDSTPAKVQYERWRSKMRKGGDIFKKNVTVQFHYLKGKANDIEIKDKMKSAYKGSKSAVKSAYKGILSNLRKDDLSSDESSRAPSRSSPEGLVATVKRNNSAPSQKMALAERSKESHFRHTIHVARSSPSSIKRGQPVKQKSDKLPPRPPPPGAKSSVAGRSTMFVDGSSSVDLSRKDFLLPPARYSGAHSEPNIASLLDFDSSSLSSWTPSEDTPEYSSTPEHLDATGVASFVNPGFKELLSPSHSFCDLTEEDVQLEYRKVPTVDNGPDVQPNGTKSTVVDATSMQGNNPSPLPHALPRPEGRGASERSKSLPPPRPPPIAKTSLMADTTLSPTIGLRTQNLLQFEPSIFYVSEPNANEHFQLNSTDCHSPEANASGTSQRSSALWTPSGTMLSTFYAPSDDLSSLDSSLFHETMSSLSAETRQMIIEDAQSPKSSSVDLGIMSDWECIGGADEPQGMFHLEGPSDSRLRPGSASAKAMISNGEATPIGLDPFESLLAETKNSFKKTQKT